MLVNKYTKWGDAKKGIRFESEVEYKVTKTGMHYIYLCDNSQTGGLMSLQVTRFTPVEFQIIEIIDIFSLILIEQWDGQSESDEEYFEEDAPADEEYYEDEMPADDAPTDGDWEDYPADEEHVE